METKQIKYLLMRFLSNSDFKDQYFIKSTNNKNVNSTNTFHNLNQKLNAKLKPEVKEHLFSTADETNCKGCNSVNEKHFLF